MMDIIDTVVWAAIIQGFLLGALYVFSRKYRSFANRLLGFFLFTLVIEGFELVQPLDYIGSFPVAATFSLPEVKLFLPLLFFHYVLEKIGQVKRYRLLLSIHYMLACLVVGLTLVNLLVFGLKGELLVEILPEGWGNAIFMTQQIYAFLLSILSIFLSVREMIRYRRVVSEEYSDIDLLQLNWLWRFIFSLVPIVLLWGVELGRITLGGTGISNIVWATWLLCVLFIYFISYQAFRYPNLFEGASPDYGEAPSLEKAVVVDSRDFTSLSQNLRLAMQSEQYYLKHDLTIYTLGQELDISPRLISACINRSFGLNFSEWVNQYRVEHARSILESPAGNQLSIEGVGHESGFKSRSAMYTAFKKTTGQTPGYFRQSTST